MAAAVLIVAATGFAVEAPNPGAAAPGLSSATAAPRMSAVQATVLGIVEGLTEYLPVSSTAHLILTQRIMGIGDGADKEAADAYAIAIQGGAILAVLLLYFKRVRSMAAGVMGWDATGRTLAINIMAAFIPTAIIGLALEKPIKAHLFGLWPITAAWFVGGAAILWVAWSRRKRGPRQGMALDHMTWRMAALIGCLQAIAMWPGTSRSLVTIVGGVIVGLSLPAAVEFSFLLGLVTLGAATAKEAHDHMGAMLHLYGPLPLIAGVLAALISAVVAIEWMVSYLNRHGMAIFGYYRVAIAIVVGTLLSMNLLNPHISQKHTPAPMQTAARR